MSFSPLSVAICCFVSMAAGVLAARFGSRLLDALEIFLLSRAGLVRQDQSNKGTPNDVLRSDGADQQAVSTAGKTLLSLSQQLQNELSVARKEIQRQRDLMSECLAESRTDSLTNIANRRAFDYEMTRAIAQHRRDGSTFSLVMLDIDYFKRINDQYGHIVGDQVLKDFAQILLSAFRASDYVARFGGEEFVAILNCPLEESCLAAERVRSVINASWIHVGHLHLQVTASFGVKEIQDQETEAELLERADAALYAAKRNGRDCCYAHQNGDCQRYVAEQDSQPGTRTKRTRVCREPGFLDKLAAEVETSNDQNEFTHVILADEILI